MCRKQTADWCVELSLSHCPGECLLPTLSLCEEVHELAKNRKYPNGHTPIDQELYSHTYTQKGKKGKVLIIYIAVLRNLGLLQDCFNNTPLDHWARSRQLQAAPKHINPHKVPNYMLGEQRHIGVNNLPKVVAR